MWQRGEWQKIRHLVELYNLKEWTLLDCRLIFLYNSVAEKIDFFKNTRLPTEYTALRKTIHIPSRAMRGVYIDIYLLLLLL